jgi:hypothetical protein
MTDVFGPNSMSVGAMSCHHANQIVIIEEAVEKPDERDPDVSCSLEPHSAACRETRQTIEPGLRRAAGRRSFAVSRLRQIATSADVSPERAWRRASHGGRVRITRGDASSRGCGGDLRRRLSPQPGSVQGARRANEARIVLTAAKVVYASVKPLG